MLQLAQAMATVAASRGLERKPQLVTAIEDATTHARSRTPVAPAAPVDLRASSPSALTPSAKRWSMSVAQVVGTSARVFAGAAYTSGG